jgi:hypothetical protein
MKFKNLETKYKLFLLLAVEAILAAASIIIKNVYVKQAIMLVYFGVFLYILVLLWRMLIKNFFLRLKNLLTDLYKFISKKVRQFIKKAKKILKAHGLGSGFDKSTIEVDFSIQREIKRIFKSKIKLDLRKADRNAEKIRLMYIKLILKSIRSGYDYDQTQTPDEIYELLKNENLDVLIDCYKSVRYDRNVIISDENVEICENILNGGK